MPNIALELGKPIMVPPGDITRPTSAGTNRLLAQGASPLLEAADILRELGIALNDQPAYIAENEVEQAILHTLADGPLSTNDILRSCDFDENTVQTHLTMLEIKGVIAPSGGIWNIL